MAKNAEIDQRATEPEYLSLREFAQKVRKCDRTIQLWGKRGIGPRQMRVRGRILYRSADINAWLASCLENERGA